MTFSDSPSRRTRRFPLARALALSCVVALGGPALAADSAEQAARPSALASVVAALPDDQRAEAAFLEHLGWRLVEDATAPKIEAKEGTPCRRETLEAAQAAGDLRIVVPAPASSQGAALGPMLAGIADSLGSRCAYVHRVHKAVAAATKKLAAAGDRGCWRFPSLLFWHSPFYVFRPPEPEWTKEGALSVANLSSEKAIRAVYERGGVAECYAAQQVAIFAIQYELYGPDWFDKVFAPRDVAVGMPLEIRPTPIGRYTAPDDPYAWRALVLGKDDQAADPGLVLARLGPRAFSGLVGIVQSQEGGDSANQNFTIVSVSETAARTLSEHGGFAYVAERSKKAYASLDAAGGLFTSAATTKARLAEVDAVLSDPVFTEFIVYCHPLGVVTLGKLVRFDMDEHGTPIFINMYTDGREDALYQRYRSAWKQRWSSENARTRDGR